MFGRKGSFCFTRGISPCRPLHGAAAKATIFLVLRADNFPLNWFAFYREKKDSTSAVLRFRLLRQRASHYCTLNLGLLPYFFTPVPTAI